MAMRRTEEPTKTREDHPGLEGHKLDHPAFGQIGASRVTGTAYLYGSDFEHNGYITITIRRSQLNRQLNRDWAFGHEELISVDLSYAQWAEFVSNMNSGTGVQCTIDHVGGERMPMLPKPSTKVDVFRDDLKRKTDDLQAAIVKARQEVEGLNITKKAKDVLLSLAWKLERLFNDSLPFAAKSFDQQMETTVEKAKIEVNAYVESAINRAGLRALAAAQGEDSRPPILMGDGDIGNPGGMDDSDGRD